MTRHTPLAASTATTTSSTANDSVDYQLLDPGICAGQVQVMPMQYFSSNNIFQKSSDMLIINKNTLDVKKCEANQKQHCK